MGMVDIKSMNKYVEIYNEAPRSRAARYQSGIPPKPTPHFAKASLGVPLTPSSSEQALGYSAKGKKVGRKYLRYIALIGILLAVIFFGNFHSRIAPKPLVNWTLTAWQMNGQGGWKEQPVILVEGQKPFFADHPQAYIEKLLELNKNPAIVRGRFHTLIGELRDGLENTWEVKP